MTQQLSFFNTNGETGAVLKASVSEANRQNARILDIYRDRLMLSPHQVLDVLESEGVHWPLTSVRRAITCLAQAGYLVKTNHRITGRYGKANYVWRLNV